MVWTYSKPLQEGSKVAAGAERNYTGAMRRGLLLPIVSCEGVGVCLAGVGSNVFLSIPERARGVRGVGDLRGGLVN